MAGSFTHLCYHLIFSTKDRMKFIDPELAQRLYEYIGGVINSIDGKPIIINGISDHILCFISKNISVSEFLKIIKSKSSKWIHESFKDSINFSWQKGYGAFTVSDSQINRVITYIKSQQDHHKKITFQEEFLKILQKLKISYEEKYIWE